MTHICVGNLTNIDSDNGLSPGRRQAIIWTNAGLLLIGPLGTNFSEILIEILTFSLKKMRLKLSSAKRRPFCLGLNELMKMPEIFKRNIFSCFRIRTKVLLWHNKEDAHTLTLILRAYIIIIAYRRMIKSTSNAMIYALYRIYTFWINKWMNKMANTM